VTVFPLAFGALKKYIHRMKTSKLHIARIGIIIFLAAAGLHGPLHAQDDGKRIIFTDPKSKDKALNNGDLIPRNNSSGFDFMIGMDGFGVGGFYGYTFGDEVTLFSDLSFSEARDARQLDYYDYWSGVTSLNKDNYVYRIPLFLGIQYRLFKDDIVDNFRPFINAGAGPVLMYIASAKTDFFTGLSHGHSRYTYGTFVGLGAQFGFDRSYVLGVNVRYFVIPLPPGIQSVDEGTMSNANGFFITLNFGSAF